VSEEGTIAFTRVSGFGTSGLKRSDIYAIDVDASQEKRLTDSPGLDGFPARSQDGEGIAYVTNPINDPQVHLMNADGTGREWLVAGNWPQPGRLIAIASPLPPTVLVE
jgi:hypothetical protein